MRVLVVFAVHVMTKTGILNSLVYHFNLHNQSMYFYIRQIDAFWQIKTISFYLNWNKSNSDLSLR